MQNCLEENIFAAVQEKYNVKEVAEQLGIRLHRVGGSDRANSIFGNGEGENAFAVYPENGRWYDFMNKQGGDIVDLVAIVKFNGDKGAAIRELMPEYVPEKIKIQKSQRDEFMKDVERWHNELFSNKPYAVRALAYLHSRGITDETIRKNKIGVKPQGPSWRLVLPYMDESGKSVLYFNTRCYDWSGKGENPNEQKYMKASHEKYPFLKNSIWGLHTLDRGKDFVVVTEGTFDALSFDQAGYSVLCTNGGDFGKLTPQAIEKMKDFKKVVLAFDNDQPGHEFTYKMARELIKERITFEVITAYKTKDVAEYYEKYGNVEILLDEYSRKGLNWCMEYLRPTTSVDNMTAREREKVMERCKEFIKEVSPFTESADIREMTMCLGSTFNKDWINDLIRAGKKGLDEVEVCNEVLAHHKLIYNDKCGFYEYEDNIWKEKTDTQIQSKIMKVLGHLTTGNKLLTNLRTLKSCEEIWSDVPLKSFNMLPRVTFQNGTLHIDLETRIATFKNHSADDYTTVKLPYRYEDKATHKKWDKFINEVTNGNEKKKKVLKEFAGYLLLPDCRFQRALMLMGTGSNGKSVFVNVLGKMLGGSQGYVSYVEPSKLVKDFRLMPFKDSWLNISSDTGNNFGGADETIKKLIAGDDVEDSYKFKSPFSFPTRSKMIMCCNNYPKVGDISEGLMRRFLMVEFPMHFTDAENITPNSKDRLLDVNLEQELLKELPGIFNWALEGLQELLAQNGFTKTDEQNRLINEFIEENSNSMTFVKDSEEKFFEVKDLVKEGKTIDKRQVFRDYRQWAEECAEFPMNRKKFYAVITIIFSRLGWEFTEKNGFWTFKDIKLAAPEYDVDDDDKENDTGYIQDADEQMNEIDNGDFAAQA
ncbi:MAG: toprim domain-containing protein [Synergistaceae bacterium]|nr:toprim domain-containing protein [Synergistaceae bacterium]